MTDHFAQSHLKNLPLFAQLTQQQLALVADITQTHRVEPGVLALRQGQTSTGMLIFISGRGVFTRLRSDGFEEQVGEVRSGQFVNEAALYAERIEPVSLRIVESSIILFIPRDAFLRLIGRYAEIRANLRVQGQPQPSPQIRAAPRATPTMPAAPTASPVGRMTETATVPRAVAHQVMPAPTVSAPAAGVNYAPSMQMNPTANEQEPPRVVGEMLFKGQRPDEQVLYVFRRHWWAFGRTLWMPILIATALIVVAILSLNVSAVLAVAVGAVGLIISGLITAYLYVEWRDDSIVLTDQRIVRIKNLLLGLESSLSEIPLDRVLEVSISMPPGDPFAYLFNYATLYIRTAGEASNLTLDKIADAKKVQALIFAQRDQFSNTVIRNQQGSIQADIQGALGMTVPKEQAQAKRATTTLNAAQPLEVDTAGLPFIRTRFRNNNGDIVYRHHSSVWVRHVFAPSLLLGAGLVLALISVLVPTLPLPPVIGISLSAVIFILGGLWFYMADWDWRNDTMIIGTDAVTITRKRPLWLQNEVERIRLSQIDNVTSEIDGLTDNLLRRGTVRISLVGSSKSDAKIFDNVYDPKSVQAEISHRLSVLRSQQQEQGIEQQRQVMLEYLTAYHQMQGGTPMQQGQVQGGMTFARPAQVDPPADPNAAPPAPSPDNIRPPRVPRPRNNP